MLGVLFFCFHHASVSEGESERENGCFNFGAPLLFQRREELNACGGIVALMSGGLCVPSVQDSRGSIMPEKCRKTKRIIVAFAALGFMLRPGCTSLSRVKNWLPV